MQPFSVVKHSVFKTQAFKSVNALEMFLINHFNNFLMVWFFLLAKQTKIYYCNSQQDYILLWQAVRATLLLLISYQQRIMIRLNNTFNNYASFIQHPFKGTLIRIYMKIFYLKFLVNCLLYFKPHRLLYCLSF